MTAAETDLCVLLLAGEPDYIWHEYGNGSAHGKSASLSISRSCAVITNHERQEWTAVPGKRLQADILRKLRNRRLFVVGRGAGKYRSDAQSDPLHLRQGQELC